jgi:hypothetical protein
VSSAWLLPSILLASCAITEPSRSVPAACAGERHAGEREPGPHPTRNLVLVAIDGTRWQEIFRGVDPELARPARVPLLSAAELLPHIHRRLIEGGIAVGAPGIGAPMSASGPEYVSLPGYQELLGGRPASACTSNHCSAVDRPTLLDRARASLRLSLEEVAAISSWERLERATSIDNRTIVLSAGRHHGPTRDHLRVNACAGALLDQAAGASAYPGHVDYRPDRYTAALALEYVSERRPRLLFVGLGDTDEFGHAHDYRGYLLSLMQLDRFIGQLFERLDGLGRYGAETTVLLTTDHGWSRDFEAHGSSAPESARVWLLAGGGAVPARGPVAAGRNHPLAAVAPTALALLGLPRQDGSEPIPELLPTAVAHALLR